MIQKLVSMSSPPADAGHRCAPHYSQAGKLVGCSREFTPRGITQFTCQSHFSYIIGGRIRCSSVDGDHCSLSFTENKIQ
ncbi:hypothetical protein ZWY2020_017487 [Hordeum vulgare]|nr:hypothetical protein ZWY2020_017487 [Hordeum vulgare]